MANKPVYVNKSNLKEQSFQIVSQWAEEIFFSYAFQPCESAHQNNSHNGTIEKALVMYVQVPQHNDWLHWSKREKN